MVSFYDWCTIHIVQQMKQPENEYYTNVWHACSTNHMYVCIYMWDIIATNP